MSWNAVRAFITLVIVTLSVLALANCQQATAIPSYTVAYNGNGNTGGTVPTDPNKYNPGKAVTVLPNSGNLTDTGFSFTGWNTQANGKGVTYPPGQTFAMGDSNVTLFALWTIAPTYTVTYNGNGNTGGTVPTDSKNYLQGQTVTVLGNTGSLTKTGYTFVGWNIQANGSGTTTYSSGQTFSMGSANVILYAQWTALPTFTVTYNRNGATGGNVPTDSSSYVQGQTVTVLGNMGNLTESGYAFSSWNTASNGTGTTYTPSSTFLMGSSNVILYAQWAPTFTVTYSGNGATGGNVPTDPNNYIQGQTVTVLGNTGSLTETAYAFSSWNTASNGTGTTYTPGQKFPMGSTSVILYAQWTALPTYVVTYNGTGNTGGSVPTDPNNYIQGQTVTVLGNTGSLTKTGYPFLGWNTQANGSGTTYSPGQTFAMGITNVILYAQWFYTVTYNGNGATGGTVPTDSNNYVPGQTVTVLGNPGSLTWTGYALAGWNTQANGSGTTYLQGQTFQVGSANMTLYATWIISTPGLAFTLSLPNGGQYIVTAGTATAFGSVIIPAYWNANPVTIIGANAGFVVTSITIPNTITTIGDYAFAGAGGLTSLTIPNSVVGIGNYSFEGLHWPYEPDNS